MLVILTIALVLTGYALYYVNGELVRQSAEVLHWSAGMVVCIALWIHISIGRRKRKTPLSNMSGVSLGRATAFPVVRAQVS